MHFCYFDVQFDFGNFFCYFFYHSHVFLVTVLLVLFLKVYLYCVMLFFQWSWFSFFLLILILQSALIVVNTCGWLKLIFNYHGQGHLEWEIKKPSWRFSEANWSFVFRPQDAQMNNYNHTVFEFYEWMFVACDDAVSSSCLCAGSDNGWLLLWWLMVVSKL